MAHIQSTGSKRKKDMETQYSLYNPDFRHLSDTDVLYNIINDKEKAELLASSLREKNSRLISKDDLMGIVGIGEKMADKILYAIEFGRRMVLNKKPELKTIKTSNDAFQIMKFDFWDLENEEMWITICDRRGAVIKKMRVSYGGTAETSCDPKIILAEAIKCKGSGIILYHNHPSGNLTPSINDDKITERLHKAAKLIDCSLLDHLIITGDKYYSYADAGRIFY